MSIERGKDALPDAILRIVDETDHDFGLLILTSFHLGLLVEEGHIYRNIGGQFVRVRMSSVEPFENYGASAPWFKSSGLERIIQEEVDQQDFLSPEEWLKRAVALNLRGSVDPVFVKRGESYTPLAAFSSPPRDPRQRIS